MPADTIWKYPLELDDTVLIAMPAGALPLSVAMQGDTPCLWAAVDSAAARQEVHRFYVRGTGHPLRLDPSACRFLGTLLLQPLGLVFHVFDGGAQEEEG